MNKTGIPYLDFCCNPGGFGCSAGCDGCWARKQAPRIGRNLHCDDCRDFKVHFHPERLVGLAKRKKPAVVGIQFTGELFDPKRITGEVFQVLDALYSAPQHDYVFLTQQIELASEAFRIWRNKNQLKRLPDNWYIGVTVRNQAELDQRAPVLLDIPGKRWLSIEPIRENIDVYPYLCDARRKQVQAGADNFSLSGFCHSPCDDCSDFDLYYCKNIHGVIIGADNRVSQPFQTRWVDNITLCCMNAAIPVYIKQVYLWRCPRCGLTMKRIDTSLKCACGLRQRDFQYSLITDPEKFPEHILRYRNLPWTLTTKQP